MNVAFQGLHGAYSEAAARNLFGRNMHAIPMETFDGVFRAVQQGDADRGIVPIENSLAGSIHQNYDLLLSHRLHIVAETHLRIEHVLMAHPLASLRSLQSVRSHPQALAQCSRFLARHPRWKVVPYFDTAGAAQSIMEGGDTRSGAIASEFAARLYGLNILKRNIENLRDNFTRFLVIGRKPCRLQHGVPAKCSVAFRPARNQVGILFRLLGVFALRDIDLLKIESRPDPHSPFQYLFYVDFAGSPLEQRIRRALEHLQEMTAEFRLLGAYPDDRSIRKRKK
jgi:prephenate dehydratase